MDQVSASDPSSIAPLPKAEFTKGVPTLGGAAWIDLINSRLIANSEPVDFLAGDESFLVWLDAMGLSRISSAVHSERRALVDLREAFVALFQALMSGANPPGHALETLNQALARRTAHFALDLVDGALHLRECVEITGPRAAALLAQSCAEHLAKADHERLRRCENPACAMVFYDRGKNNRRRWCSTTVCGNRSKVAQYRARQRARRSAD